MGAITGAYSNHLIESPCRKYLRHYPRSWRNSLGTTDKATRQPGSATILTSAQPRLLTRLTHICASPRMHSRAFAWFGSPLSKCLMERLPYSDEMSLFSFNAQLRKCAIGHRHLLSADFHRRRMSDRPHPT